MQSRSGQFIVWVWGASGLFGCALRAGEGDALAQELARSRQQAVVSELRLAELERRLSELQHGSPRPDPAAEVQSQILYRLDLLVSQNQHLLERLSNAQPADPFGGEARLPEAPASPAVCEDAVDPEEALRRSVERLRNDPTRWRDGLTPAQNEAVNVLLRRRRPLDPSNPWSS